MYQSNLPPQKKKKKKISALTFTCPLIMRVVGAPQMTSQPVSSSFLYSSLPSGTWPTPGLFTHWCCLSPLPLSALSSSPFLPCLARWFWPDLMNGLHVHTTPVCIYVPWSGLLCQSWFNHSQSLPPPPFPSCTDGKQTSWRYWGTRMDPTLCY